MATSQSWFESASRWWRAGLGLGAVGLLCVSANVASAAATSKGYALEPMPRNLEIKYALSAFPPHLREAAAVYVLDPAKGYVLARPGTNGFHCFVGRTEYGREDFAGNLYFPIGFDPEGAKTILPVYFDVARIRIEGKMSPEEVKQWVLKRVKDGTYRSPSRPGISYMVSPVMTGYRGPGSKEIATMNMPHLMFYAPNLSRDDFGAGTPRGTYPYLLDPGPHAYMIQNIGEAEKARISEESKDLLRELCAYRSELCIDTPAAVHHVR